MRVITGRVVDGRIELEAEIEEGSSVAILAADESGFRLTAEDEDELTAALEAIRGGSYVGGRKLLEELRALTPR